MAKLSSHLGHIAAEVKGFVSALVSTAHVGVGLAALVDATFPAHRVSDFDCSVPVQVLIGWLEPATWSAIRFLEDEGRPMCALPQAAI